MLMQANWYWQAGHCCFQTMRTIWTSTHLCFCCRSLQNYKIPAVDTETYCNRKQVALGVCSLSACTLLASFSTLLRMFASSGNFCWTLKVMACPVFIACNTSQICVKEDCGAYKLCMDTVVPRAACAGTLLGDVAKLWHRRIGHVNITTVIGMKWQNAVRRLPRGCRRWVVM